LTLSRISPLRAFGLAAVYLSAPAWAAPAHGKAKKPPVVVHLGPVKRVELQGVALNGAYGTGMHFPSNAAPYLALAGKDNSIVKVPLADIKKIDFEMVGDDKKDKEACPLYKVTAKLGKKKSSEGLLDLGNVWGYQAKGGDSWKLLMCGGQQSAWRELRSIEFNVPQTAAPKKGSKK
jgi:hypothetical protein